jgi:deoxyribodipyrimidine photo-lyase
MPTAVVVFTRDLRVRDHPALRAAARDGRLVPLFVVDDALVRRGVAGPNRIGFLLDALADLDGSLRSRGSGLVVRRGSWVREVVRTARAHHAATIHLTADVSAYARTRVGALEDAAGRERRAVVTHPGHFAVEPGAVVPDGKDHFSVFTPYHRRWREAPRRALAPLPRRLVLPEGVEVGVPPGLDALGRGTLAPDVASGGEDRARRRLRAWSRRVAGYGDTRDALGAAGTSGLSPYLHLGCVSARQVEDAVTGRHGAEPFLRQLCWRDFFAQVLAARPETAWSDFRGAPVRWRRDEAGLAAWRDGRTGYPLVDAAMRQLAQEGFVHNRARMVAASFLTKDLRIDWREGAAHFLAHLVDGDLASNNLSWQWVAGTGTGANPGRVLNPVIQARRFDPGGEYVRRYVAELAPVAPPAIFDPPPDVRAATGYPAPIVDHDEAAAEYRARLAL